MKTPKTAEELFDCKTDCYACTGRFENDDSYTEGEVIQAITKHKFLEALAEHDKEIKALIETKIKGWELRQERAIEEEKKIEEEVANFVLAELTELKTKLLDVTAIENGKKYKPRQFWVEIQHMESFDEKDNPNEAIYIQRNREDLDNVGEVFRVTEDLL